MELLQIYGTLALVLSNALPSQQTYQEVNKGIIFKWKTPEFEYPSEEARNEAIKQKRFIPTNALIMDADYYAPTGRYFVSLPLFRTGVPASLAEVVGREAILRPFPRWPRYDETTRTLSCDGPYSVFRFYIDRCGLMWVLDSGLGSAGDFDYKKYCPPKLMVYDLNNGDREIMRYVFPEEDFVQRSNPTTFAVESYQNDCSDSFVYVTDEMGHGLVVFDYAQKTSWRVEDPSFYPYPNHHLFDVNGIKYSVMAGIFGITLGPIESDRKLYYHAFSSVVESWVPVSVLKNKTTAQRDRIRGPLMVTSPGERAGYSTVEVMTDDGILIYPLLQDNALVCWNSRTPFTIENQHVLERDDVNFQYIGGLKLKDNTLFITSCRYQNFLYMLENSTEYNYRVIVIENVQRLIANTPCANSQDYAGENNYIGNSFGAYSNAAVGLNAQLAYNDASAGFENTNYVANRVATPNAGVANSPAVSNDVGAGYENSEYVGVYPNAGGMNSQLTFNHANMVGFENNNNYIAKRFGAPSANSMMKYSAYNGYAAAPNSVQSDVPYQSTSSAYQQQAAGYRQSADSSYVFPFAGAFNQHSNGVWSARNRR